MRTWKNWSLALSIVLAISMIAPMSYAETTTEKDKIKIKLPRQPEVWEIYKTLKKEDFKANSVTDYPESVPIKNESYIHRFPGFFGPYAVEEIVGDQVTVIQKSLNIATSGNWKAMGLVRNETTSTTGNITVEAILIDSNGDAIERVKGISMVQGVRPGEPAPFEITSKTPIDQVAIVEWHATANPIQENYSRETNITVDYELPYGQETYRGQIRDDAPYPYRLSVSFDNLGGKIKNANLIIVWLNQEGKMIWYDQSSLDPIFSNGIDINGAGYFKDIVVNQSEVGKVLSEALYMMWVVAK